MVHVGNIHFGVSFRVLLICFGFEPGFWYFEIFGDNFYLLHKRQNQTTKQQREFFLFNFHARTKPTNENKSQNLLREREEKKKTFNVTTYYSTPVTAPTKKLDLSKTHTHTHTLLHFPHWNHRHSFLLSS